jgi:hypothetical protein
VVAFLWLGDNIAILFMEKRAHLFYSNKLYILTFDMLKILWRI